MSIDLDLPDPGPAFRLCGLRAAVVHIYPEPATVGERVHVIVGAHIVELAEEDEIALLRDLLPRTRRTEFAIDVFGQIMGDPPITSMARLDFGLRPTGIIRNRVRISELHFQLDPMPNFVYVVQLLPLYNIHCTDH